jgi:hypothetical protein
MGLESGTTIAQLNESWPLPTDSRSEGDDHLKLIKEVLKAQFPGVNGQGYDQTILATEDELNYSTGLTGNIQGQFQALYDLIGVGFTTVVAPAGTKMLFSSDVIPVAWTVQNYGTDYMLRIIDPSQGDVPRNIGDDPFNINLNHQHDLPASIHKAAIGSDLVIVGQAVTDFAPKPPGNEWSPRYINAVVARRDDF